MNKDDIYTFRAFSPLVTHLRDCHAWNECLDGAPDWDWAVGLWLLALCLKAGAEPKRVSIIANLMGRKVRYG